MYGPFLNMATVDMDKSGRCSYSWMEWHVKSTNLDHVRRL